MKAVVHVRARLGVGLLALEHVAVGLVVQEVAEHGGEAADGRVRGLGGVFGDLLAEAEVHVRLDQAGKHVQAVDAALAHVIADLRAGREQGGDAPDSTRMSCGNGSRSALTTVPPRRM